MSDSPDKGSSHNPSKEAAIHYDQFFGPLFFEPYAVEIAGRIDPAKAVKVLELAAGTGRVTRHIRERMAASAQLVASDIDEEMLAIARDKLSHFDIDWQTIDARQLPFTPNSLSLVICCFGYMFVPDRQTALAEAFRVLQPGGHFLFTTWDKLEKNAASFSSVTLANEYLEEPLRESDNLATSMNDEASICLQLKKAGFEKIAIEKVGLYSISPTAKGAACGLVDGGLAYSDIKKRDPGLIDEIKLKLERQLAEKYGAAPMIAPMSAVVVEAWK